MTLRDLIKELVSLSDSICLDEPVTVFVGDREFQIKEIILHGLTTHLAFELGEEKL